ncbi:hypothetical protein CBF34_04205 [Vagococcus penaei]|uniref:Uncharacterized protein n=1 Tax=Vagococcus penaei TaxID=633807 RepID=A0A1Q2D8L5_9ENTE|nr:hypothetical protein [Vagococcus penaei]AQP54734.1 hypothetical protein BW732_11300 [Vagococcus penaei]RSU05390.1 hypothetical protein CBF34_04205 [Vagococcus penaei]
MSKKALHQKIINFMKNRYGKNDLLNRHMLFISVVLLLISPFVSWKYFVVAPIVIIVIIYMRMLSKNSYKREEENRQYCLFMKPLLFNWTKFKERNKYVYLSCDKCQQKLRLPKNQGTIRITCPNCKHHQETKT